MSSHVQELARIRLELNDLRASQMVRPTSPRLAAVNRMNNDLRALRGSVNTSLTVTPHDQQLITVNNVSSQLIAQLRNM